MKRIWPLSVGSGGGSPTFRFANTLPGYLRRDPLAGARTHCILRMPASVAGIHAGWTAKSRKHLKWQPKELLRDFVGIVMRGRGSRLEKHINRAFEFLIFVLWYHDLQD